MWLGHVECSTGLIAIACKLDVTTQSRQTRSVEVVIFHDQVAMKMKLTCTCTKYCIILEKKDFL